MNFKAMILVIGATAGAAALPAAAEAMPIQAPTSIAGSPAAEQVRYRGEVYAYQHPHHQYHSRQYEYDIRHNIHSPQYRRYARHHRHHHSD